MARLWLWLLRCTSLRCDCAMLPFKVWVHQFQIWVSLTPWNKPLSGDLVRVDFQLVPIRSQTSTNCIDFEKLKDLLSQLNEEVSGWRREKGACSEISFSVSKDHYENMINSNERQIDVRGRHYSKTLGRHTYFSRRLTRLWQHNGSPPPHKEK